MFFAEGGKKSVITSLLDSEQLKPGAENFFL